MASPPIQTGGGYNAAKDASDLVHSQIDEMNDRADSAITQATSVMQSLTDFTPISLPADPTPPDINPGSYVVPPATAGAPTIPAGLVPDIDDLPDIVMGDGSDLIGDLSGIDDDLDAIGTFTPSITAIAIPDAPSPIDTDGAPDRPTLDVVTLPDAPTIALPSLDNLEDIVIPTFTFPNLPTFDAQAPEFEGDLPTVSALATWEEPQYATEVIGDVMVSVRKMLNGETGLPAPIEEAIYARSRSREDLTARQNVQQAMDTWAGRGFEMPPGMLVEQVNAAQDDAALRSNSATRDVSIEVFRTAMENLRQAVAQGIAAEQTLYNIFNNGTARVFEMAKAKLDSEIALYNAQVSLFNARQTAYQVAAQVFEAKLRAELSSLEVYKAQIDGARALSDFNESKVRVYAAKVDALKSSIQIYTAQMEGAKVQSELNQNRIEAYKTDVDAYKTRLEARKVEFDAFDSQVRGETAKVGIVTAQADAFAATVRAVEAKGNVKVAMVQARVAALGAAVNEFTARTQAARDKISAQAQVAQANVSAFTADVQRYSVELGASNSANEVQIRALDVYLRTQLSQYEIAIKRYESVIQTIVEQAKIQADSIRAAGQMSAQLAAGAMSAMQVGATLRGGGDINYSESLGTNISYQTEF